MPELNLPEKAPQTNEELHKWLREVMNNDRCWLLAHADDGVIWGKWENDAIATSHDVAPDISPALRLVTLQQSFIFGARDEVRLWRDDDVWRARLIDETQLPALCSICECQVLWGSHIVRQLIGKNGVIFSHLCERVFNYGMDHVVPLSVTPDDLKARRLKLHIRHLITRDEETGEARIFLSRLAGLRLEPVLGGEQ
jgi:CRISPR-associated protein (TIGR03984 family)